MIKQSIILPNIFASYRAREESLPPVHDTATLDMLPEINHFTILGNVKLTVEISFVDETIIASFLGGAAIGEYETLKPLLDNERKLWQDKRFQQYFEEFVGVSKKASIRTVGVQPSQQERR